MSQKRRSPALKLITKLTRKPKILQRLTGLNLKQFKKLCKRTRLLWRKLEKDRSQQTSRKRKVGAGRKYNLDTMEEKLALILIYYRTYTIQDLLGYMFGIDQSNVSRLIKKLEPLIEMAASPQLKGQLNQLKKAHCLGKPVGWAEFIELYPDAAGIITDATEVRCLRPKDKEKQRMYYSGKKKAHTIKTQLTVSKTTECILNVSHSYAGSVHDKKIFDIEKTNENVCKETPHWMDLGYLGVQRNYPEHYNILPIKRKGKEELSELAKESNQAHRSIRILIEHILSRIKKFHILAQVYRGKKDRFNQTFRNIAAIYNFNIEEIRTIS